MASLLAYFSLLSLNPPSPLIHPLHPHYHTIVIGGGVAGSSALLELSRHAAGPVLLLERGSIGVGIVNPQPELGFQKHQKYQEPNAFDTVDKEEIQQGLARAKQSGTAVFGNAALATTIKMMTQLYPSDSESFVKHHGKKGAELYLEMAKED